MVGFIFGGNTGTDYETLQRKRKIADQMREQSISGTPRNVGEGLTAIGQALAGVVMDKRLKGQEADARQEGISALESAYGGLTGSASPAPYSPSPDTAEGVASDTMKALGKGNGDKEAFIAQMMPHAMKVSQETGLDPRLVIAQAAQETGWGRSAPNNNYFGIKSHGQGGGSVQATNEFENGQMVSKNESFRGYGDMGQSAEDYARFIKENPRYQPMLQAQGLDQQLEALGQSGYATDPNYAQSVGSIARGIPAPQQGNPQATIQALSKALSNPYLPPEQKAIAQALLGQTMQQMDPMNRLQMEKAQLEVQAMRNPTPEQTAGMREYNLAKQHGFDGSFVDFKTALANAGRTSITNNVGGEPGAKPLGTEGQILVPDANAPGGFRVELAEGSKAWRDAQSEESANEQSQTNRERSGGIVTEDIGRALSIIEDDPNWTTGFGAQLKRLPGTQAKSLSGLLETIKANVGFDRLQQMRDASKTGGALGAINKTEMDLLQAVLGNLDQSLDTEDLAKNLSRVNDIYLDIIHGPGNRPDTTPAPADGATGEIPEGIDPADWEFMTPEEKALFQ